MRQRMPTTEAAIETYGFSHSICNWGDPGGWRCRVWHKPFITSIWLGRCSCVGRIAVADYRACGSGRPDRRGPRPRPPNEAPHSCSDAGLVAFDCAGSQSDEMLADPALEPRAPFRQTAVLVCQTSHRRREPAGRDLRIIVRERLVAGDSDRR